MADNRPDPTDVAALRLIRLGHALYGSRWKAALAEHADIPRTTLFNAATDKGPRLTKAMKRRLRLFVEAEQMRLFLEAHRKNEALREAADWLREDEP